jgi:small subunit ribosomal protein S6
MPLYEHVFLARQDASTQQVEELTTQMTGIVEGLGGKVTKTENWGVRSLTYRMNKNRKAHFVLLNIDGPSAAISEVERQERISEDVIRYLSVRVDEHEDGPVAASVATATADSAAIVMAASAASAARAVRAKMSK